MLDRAIESIRAQAVAHTVDLQIVIGIDAGSNVPPHLAGNSQIRFVESAGRSQAAALNAAAKAMDGDIVSILEDDDQWHPHFLGYGLAQLQHSDFVSSTQLEVAPDDNILRVVDFPTPSGWIMKRSTWDAVGGFEEAFRWHLDNEWLGRLGRSGVRRLHLVEATAPIDMHGALSVRPGLVNCLQFGGPSIRLARHALPWPLVKRLVHPGSGMARIATDQALSAESQRELDLLSETYGHIPW